MNGCDVKKLIIMSGGNLNDYDYFENDKIYKFNEIPKVYVDKSVIQKKMQDKYNKNVAKYILEATHNNNENSVCPQDMLTAIKNDFFFA